MRHVCRLTLPIAALSPLSFTSISAINLLNIQPCLSICLSKDQNYHFLIAEDMFTEDQQVRLVFITTHCKAAIWEDQYLRTVSTLPDLTWLYYHPDPGFLAIQATPSHNQTPASAICLPASYPTSLPVTELIFLPQLLNQAEP